MQHYNPAHSPFATCPEQILLTPQAVFFYRHNLLSNSHLNGFNSSSEFNFLKTLCTDILLFVLITF